ncbi:MULTISPECIES: DUF6192 family protein [Streptomyces]
MPLRVQCAGRRGHRAGRHRPAQAAGGDRARHPGRKGPGPAVRATEHTIAYLDLVGSCHGFVATLGRLVPQLRGQEFTEDERETVGWQIGRVRAAADWFEGILDNGEFTLDEQQVQLLKGE